MTLDEAATRLAEAAGTSHRDYSTYDFGRERDPQAKSVIAPSEHSSRLVHELRGQVGPNIIVFVGTTSWLGDEIVVAQGRDQFDILRVARSDAVNYDMGTEDLIKKLRSYDQQFGIDIFHAETDTIELGLVEMPDDLTAFCQDLYEFCPDIVDQGTGTVERLEEEIREAEQVFLWWD